MKYNVGRSVSIVQGVQLVRSVVVNRSVALVVFVDIVLKQCYLNTESDSHLRCCTTRSKSSCNFDLFTSYTLMFLDSIFEKLLLVTLTPPTVPDLMNFEYWKDVLVL